MNRTTEEPVAGAAASSDPAAVGAAPKLRIKFGQACRQIFGIPDYERYLEHFAMHHPGEKPLSRAEFVARSIDRRYGKSGPRCC